MVNLGVPFRAYMPIPVSRADFVKSLLTYRDETVSPRNITDGFRFIEETPDGDEGVELYVCVTGIARSMIRSVSTSFDLPFEVISYENYVVHGICAVEGKDKAYFFKGLFDLKESEAFIMLTAEALQD